MPELGLWDRSVPIATRDRVGMAKTDALHLPKKARALHHGRRLVTSATCNYKKCDVYFETILVATLPFVSNIAHSVVACIPEFGNAEPT